MITVEHMRIGINARTFSVNEPDGAVQVASRISNQISQFDDVNTTYFGHESITIQNDANVRSKFFVFNSQMYGAIWERLFMPSMLSDTEKYDILFSPNGNAPFIDVDAKSVMLIHDVGALRNYQSRLQQVHRKLFLPLSLKKSDHIVTISEFSKNEIMRLFDIDRQKISVINNGIDSIYLNDSGENSISVPDKYILFVGGLNPRKNISSVISSYDSLKKEHGIEHKLVMTGPQNSTAYKKLDEPLPDTVHHTGYISKSKLKFVYEQADALVFPSFYEGFGLPPLEAMACGTPVVSSDAASMPEILGPAAHYVDPHDNDEIGRGIYRVLTDNRYRQKLIQLGKNQANKYRWEDTYQQYHNLFKKLLN